MALDIANLAPIEGARPVIEAIRAGRRQVHAVHLPEGDGSAARRELEVLLRERSIERHAARKGEGVHAFADPFPEEEFEALLPVSFAFAAGAMLALVVLELVPQAFTRRTWRMALVGAAGGAAVMLALSAAIGV